MMNGKSTTTTVGQTNLQMQLSGAQLKASILTFLTLTLMATAAAVATASSSASGSNQGPWWVGSESTHVIQTDDGPVAGWRVDGVDHFANIPFATPPVGNLRFTSPTPPSKWNETRQWQGPGILPMCPQMKFGPFNLGNEDCLYLDVYVPTSASLNPTANPLPVLFWIYGGAYVIGDKYEFGWYDGHHLVKNTDVILVTSNYRLGAFGFMALDQLRDENAHRSTGNYALQDQQLAMRWVDTNIGRFGGDPKRVTIFGESAGSFSVCSHLAMPSSWGLFSAAIGESGGCDWAHNYTLARNISETFGESLGCHANSSDFVACLRALPANKLLASGPYLTHNKAPLFDPMDPLARRLHYSAMMLPPSAPPPVHTHAIPSYPVIDNAVTGLSGRPIDLITTGKWARVPVIQGSNRDEYALFMLMAPFVPDLNVTLPLTWKSLNQTILFFYGPQVLDTVFAVYPTSHYKNPDSLFSDLATDRAFFCVQRRALRAMAATGGTVYQYYFTYAPKWIDVDILGVYHTLELDFVFGNAWPPVVHSLLGVNETTIMHTFQTYWSNLAKSGNPNVPKPVAAEWPLYNPNTRLGLNIDIPSRMVKNLRDRQCNYWDQFDP